MRTNYWLGAVLRLFFRLLYNEFAWTYDFVAWIVSSGRWKRWVISCLPYLEGPRVLELGHGPGHLLLALAENGNIPVGVDASPQMSRQAQRRFRKKLQPKSTVHLIQAKSPFLPFTDQSFDQVVATFPTEYIFTSDTLREIKRLLKYGGSLIVLPVAWITGHRWLDRLAAGLFRVTGQAPEWDERMLIPFIQAGFSTTAQSLALGDSRVMLIKAIKS